jgi:hypothetical protein
LRSGAVLVHPGQQVVRHEPAKFACRKGQGDPFLHVPFLDIIYLTPRLPWTSAVDICHFQSFVDPNHGGGSHSRKEDLFGGLQSRRPSMSAKTTTSSVGHVRENPCGGHPGHLYRHAQPQSAEETRCPAVRARPGYHLTDSDISGANQISPAISLGVHLGLTNFPHAVSDTVLERPSTSPRHSRALWHPGKPGGILLVAR